MGDKIFRKFIFLILFFPNVTLAQEIPEEATKLVWMEFKTEQSKFNEKLKKEIDSIKIDGDIDLQKYIEVNDLWKNVAEQLKESIDDPYTEIFSEEKELNEELLHSWGEQITERFALLRLAGDKRVKAMDSLRVSGKNIFLVDKKIFSTILLEVQLVPYKFKAYLHEKSFWFKESLSGGVVGFLRLAWQLLLFILILLIPVGFIKSSRYTHTLLNKQKNKSFYLSYKSNLHRFLTNFLPFFIEVLPWLLALVAISVMERILEYSEFREFKYGLPYFNYYIYYKLFRVILEFFLQNFAAQFDAIKQGDVGKKAKKTSFILGLFLFITYSVREAFHSILGKSLTFFLLEPLFGYSTVLVLFYLANKWKEEIVTYLKQTGNKYLAKLSELLSTKLSFIICLPTVVIIVAHYIVNLVIDWGSQFDFVKLVYAKILRIKIESGQKASGEDTKAPEEYRENFLENLDNGNISLEVDDDFSGKIFEQIEKWKKGSTDEQTVAVFGERGSGKTKILEFFKSTQKLNELNITQLSVPQRLFTNKNLENFLEECQLGEPREKRTKVVLVDDAHNMFLSTIGGFEIYKKFLEIIEGRRDIFWVVTFNEQPWVYLNSVLGKNQYFRLELKTPRWNVEKIKEFILSAHESTEFKLKYNQIFKSSQNVNDGLSSVENRYFYLLWEKANGNPGQAVQLWFKSIRTLYNRNLEISLPRENNVSEFNKLHQDMHFTYSSLVKHENLTLSEATRATNLPRSVVKQSLYRGLEEGFLSVSEGRYTISRDWSIDLLKFLKGKNLVYESNR